MSFDVWMEAIEDGRKEDILILFALSILMDFHTYVHLHEGQYWTMLKTVPNTHKEVLSACAIHVLYLGRGMFVKLKKCEIPLSTAPNVDPRVTSYIIGELTPAKQTAYDDILFSGLGIRHGNTERGCTLPPSASAGSASDRHRVESEVKCKLTSPIPLDLSVTIEPKMDTPILSLLLDHTSTGTRDMQEKPKQSQPELPVMETPEEQAMLDNPLTPSPTVKTIHDPLDKMDDTVQLKCDVKILINKLNLQEGQTVKVTQDTLEKLPLNKYTPVSHS